MDRGIGFCADTPYASCKAREALQVGWRNKDVSTDLPTLTDERRLIQILERPDVSARHDADVPVESCMDEMAHPSGREPLEFRMQHLKHNPRDYRTLEVVAQVEGALTMGLSSALKEKLESSEGGFQSANFSAYQLPPMSKAPDVEVPILESDGLIVGMGETGLPPVAPVVANAVFAATGTRIRRLPMTPATFLETRAKG